VSGYLITLLLLAEYRTHHTLHLKHFWQRRARRLLPALYAVMLAVLVYAVMYLPDEVASLRADIVSAFTYSTNWYLIFAQKSYFETVGRPSPLRHLWSLAVEEQFYLVWPLFFTSVLARFKAQCAMLVLVLGAAVSALWMSTLFQPNVDPSRVYYGTDTRATGLLLGAALAFVWTPHPASVTKTSVGAWLLDLIGCGALGGLIAACYLCNEFAAFLYQGGMLLVAAATTLVIAAVVHPPSPFLGPVMSLRGLRWIGLRSYSLYLWHWPVFMVTRPQLDIMLSGVELFAVRLGVTFLLAELSYRLIEMPIRQGALGKAWTAWHHAQGVRRWGIGLVGMGAVTSLVIAVLLLSSAVMNAQPPRQPNSISIAVQEESGTFETPVHMPAVSERLDAAASAWSLGHAQNQQRPNDAAEQARIAQEAGCTAACQTSEPMHQMAKDDGPSAVPPTPTLLPTTMASVTLPPPPQAAQVLAIGDSVMLSASAYLRQAVTEIDVDATVGRQVAAALQILRTRKATNRLAPTVIIHLGNNGTFSTEQFDDMMQLLHNVPRVLFLTNKVPRTWQRPNNLTLADGVKRYPNARLVDWYAQSATHPEWFGRDGIHLRPAGASVYAYLITMAMQ
jgi:peptidoglycan/LPS O-acetylase OafA/YrhL